MSVDFQLLKTVIETPGAPGHEYRIRQAIAEIVRPLVDEIRTDNVGNLVCVKRGRKPGGPKVALAAHMDEISFMVSHIEEDGFLRFIPLGGFDPRTLIAQRVLVHGREQDLLGVIAVKPIHISSPEDLKKELQIEHLMIDLGLPAAEVRQAVAVGDTATRIGDLKEMGQCLMGKSLDNRISVYILIEALRQFEGCEHDVYAGFTVQEEVGLRGAEVFARTLAPDFAFNIDTTIAYDMSGSSAKERVTRLGDGVGIKLYDGATIIDKRMYHYLQRLCQDHQIPWQAEVLKRGGTDTGMLQRAGAGGSIAGALSVPTRHIHTSVETVHQTDVLAAIRLLVKALAELSTFPTAW